MLHINKYPVWPDGTRKKQSGFGPLSGTLIEKYDARYAFDPNDLAVAGNPWGLPTFLWIEGDGTGATIGPAGLNLAVTGAVSQVVTPYQYPSLVDATAEYYDGVSCRADATKPVDPALTNDIVVMVKARHHDNAAGGGPFQLVGTGQVGGFVQTNCWALGMINNDISFYADSGFGFPSGPTWTNPGWRSYFCAGIVVNRNGNSYAWGNGEAGNNVASIALTLAGAHGIGIGGPPNVAAAQRARLGTCIEWVAIWYGDGLYEVWSADSWRLVKRLQSEAIGLRETEANKVAGVNKYWLYTKGGNAGATSYQDHNGVWRFGGRQGVRAGNPNGLFCSPGDTNTVAGSGNPNYDVAVTTSWTLTGGAIAVVSDAAALAAANASIWGPNVWEITNATGVTQVAYRGADANALPCNFFVLARYVAGANALIGWRDSSSGVFTSVGTILDGYALTRVLQQTPPDADCKYAIQLPDGCVLRLIGVSLDNNALGVGVSKYPRPASGTPYLGNATVPEGATTEHTPVVLSGSYLVNMAPLSWSGVGCLLDDGILPCVTTPGDILHAETVAAGWATGDGTTQIQTVAPFVPTVGVYVDVWTAWRGALQYIQQNIIGTAVVGAYDLNKGMVGAMKVMPTLHSGDIAVKYLEIRQV